jgi:hypothetical protein
VALPANSSSGNLHISYRPIDELPYYVDLLRNESPINMALDSAHPERHNLHNGTFEPVGEGE